MTHRLSKSAAGLGLAVLLAVSPGFAGDESVDPVAPVFVPPLVFPGVPGAALTPEAAAPLEGLPQVESVAEVAAVVGQQATPQATRAIVNSLDDASLFCARIPAAEYAVDCLSYRLWLVQENMPDTGEYSEVKAALATAAIKLNRLANRNADRVLPRGVARTPDGAVTNRRLTPVSTESLPEINRQAIAILEEAETVLLRSAQASEARRIPYQQIAAAVNSNKVLLRSL